MYKEGLGRKSSKARYLAGYLILKLFCRVILFLPAIRWCTNIVRQARARSHTITIPALRVRAAGVGLTGVCRHGAGRPCCNNNLAAAAEWIAGITGSTLADRVVVHYLTTGIVSTGTWRGMQVLGEILKCGVGI